MKCNYRGCKEVAVVKGKAQDFLKSKAGILIVPVNACEEHSKMKTFIKD